MGDLDAAVRVVMGGRRIVHWPPQVCVLHGESNTDRASPRTPTQRTLQPQEAVQPQRNQTILQADTPAQKSNYSYKWSHPTPHEADAHTATGM